MLEVSASFDPCRFPMPSGPQDDAIGLCDGVLGPEESHHVAVRRDTPRYAAMRRDTSRYAAVRRDTPRYAAIRRDTSRYPTMRRDTP